MAEEFDAIPAEPPTVEVKLFGKWSSDEVHVNDISLSVRACWICWACGKLANILCDCRIT